MGCGCKKKQNVEPAPEPANISLVNVQVGSTPQTELTQEQQQQVETIIEKLNEMSS